MLCLLQVSSIQMGKWGRSKISVGTGTQAARALGRRLVWGHFDVGKAPAPPPPDGHTPALVLRAGVGVQVEAGDVLIAIVDLEIPHVRVPHLRFAIRRHDLDVEDALAQPEEAVEDRGQREVRAQLLLRAEDRT